MSVWAGQVAAHRADFQNIAFVVCRFGEEPVFRKIVDIVENLAHVAVMMLALEDQVACSPGLEVPLHFCRQCS